MNITALISVPVPVYFHLLWISDRTSSPFLSLLYKNYLGYSCTITLPYKLYNQLDKLHLRNPVGMFPGTALNLQVWGCWEERILFSFPIQEHSVFSYLFMSSFMSLSFIAFSIVTLRICLPKVTTLSSANNENIASSFPISFTLLPGKFTLSWRSDRYGQPSKSFLQCPLYFRLFETISAVRGMSFSISFTGDETFILF